MEYIERNWLHKQIKKVRRSQASILINFCDELTKTRMFGLSGSRPLTLIFGPWPPQNFQAAQTSSYLKSSHYDNVHITFDGLWVI